MPGDDVAMARLDDQMQWYDKKSHRNLQWFKVLKTMTIILASLIPVVTGSIDPRHASHIAGVIGALVAVIEALQHLNQFQENWITYRSACEALRREKYLFLASAGPYVGAVNPQALLLERVESVISQENTKWTATREPSQKGVPPQ